MSEAAPARKVAPVAEFSRLRKSFGGVQALRDKGLLFGSVETPESLAAAQAKMAATEVHTCWQEFMAPFFESADGVRAHEMFFELKEVFHLD